MVPDFGSYDRIIVALSGGKDSLACLLHLIELGVPLHKIELWHHLVDGREGSSLFDWACTESYVQALARHFDLPVCFSWREGGFEREMLRQETATAATCFETPAGLVRAGGKGTHLGTRLKYPQVSADLKVRWCSAALKIDVSRRALANQERFKHSRTLFITGERAEESPGRAKYSPIEPHATDKRDSPKLRRHVDHYRPVLYWRETDVWQVIERFGINPHPCYFLGFGRCSCEFCIFGSDDQWATLALIDPDRLARHVAYETQFGLTIHRSLSIMERVKRGTPYPSLDPADVAAALSVCFVQAIVLPPSQWRLPAGAYGESSGPS